MREQGNISVKNILIILLLLLCISKHAVAHKSIQQLEELGKARVIVFFKDTPDVAVVERYNANILHILKVTKGIVCEIDKNNIDLLKNEPEIKDVVYDVVMEMESEYEEPMNEPISLMYSGVAPLRWNVQSAGLNAEAAWNRYDIGGSGIIIAFLDSGVNYTLADLDDNYIGGVDIFDGDDDPITYDVDERHGTYVVSTSVGEGDDIVVGPAYGASYYVVRITDGVSSSFVSNAMAGIEWAMEPDHKADIINMSFGINRNHVLWPSIEPSFRDTVNSAYNAGIVLVAATGNETEPQSNYPAAFENVIAVGGHAEDQNLFIESNGGADIIAPGYRVPALRPDNSGWWVWGTSFAAPHAAALIALQLQYARENNIEVNNGYIYEAIKHSAIDLGLDPVYQGKGKAWAAESLPTPDPNDGAIDLLASNWPLDFNVDFTTPKYERDNIPAYYITESMTQDVNVINITDTYGQYLDDIMDLTITTKQNYYQRENNNYLPGDPNEIVPGLSVNTGEELSFSDFYDIPSETVSGMNQTAIEFDFQFSGINRDISIAYNDPNTLWLSVNELTADFEPDGDVDLADYSVLSGEWGETGVLNADIAPELVDGTVDILDLLEFISQWLEDAFQ